MIKNVGLSYKISKMIILHLIILDWNGPMKSFFGWTNPPHEVLISYHKSIDKFFAMNQLI